jgi:hypothetical protein
MAEGDGAQRWTKSSTNPNDSIGGGGCFCGYNRCEDRGGPYFSSQAIETDNGLSPFVVVCAPCVVGMAAAISDDTESLPLGEPVIVSEAVELDASIDLVGYPTGRPESPASEDGWPALDDPAI